MDREKSSWPSLGKGIWWFVAGLIVVVGVLSFRSITASLSAVDQQNGVQSAAEVNISLPPAVQPSETVTPVSPTMSEQTQSPPAISETERMIQREETQRETAKTMRNFAKENPDSENVLSEETIKKIEKGEVVIR